MECYSKVEKAGCRECLLHKFSKTDLCIKPDASINIFFKIYLHSHIPRHRFKKINPKNFGKFQKKTIFV